MKNVGTVERESYTLRNKEKLKCNNVARGILGNGSTFDVKKQSKLRKNSAITLIALVITIVVLLILAGVTLNVIIGNNGILNKTKESKEKTEIAKYEEELGMCVLDLQVEESGNTFDMDVLRSKFVEKVKENENTDDIEIVLEEGNTTIEGVYKGYEFTIDEKYVVHIGQKSTGVRAMMELSPKGYTNQNVTATITIKCNNGISIIKQTKPSSETEINVNGAKEYTITKSDISENTIYEYEITDSQGNKTPKTIEITTIDKVSPKDFKITAECINGILKITGTTTDEESGIARYEYYIKKSTDSEFIKKDTNEITDLSAGTYSVYAVAYDKAENSTKSNTLENIIVTRPLKTTNISAEDVFESPEGYYGKQVNYTSSNGQNDWKIFYSDGTYIFLITGDYVDITDEAGEIDTNKLSANTGMQKVEGAQKYRVNWTWGSDPDFQEIEPKILSRFKATEYALQNNKPNSKCVSTLLNPENWIGYLDSEINGKSKGEYAIGGATIEMLNDSLQKRYPSSQKIYLNAKSGNPGYYVGWLTVPNTSGVNLSTKEYYEDELYYPHKEKISDGTATVDKYWIASPSAYNTDSTNQYILYVEYDGLVDCAGYSNTRIGLRPVVSLKEGATVDIKK